MHHIIFVSKLQQEEVVLQDGCVPGAHHHSGTQGDSAETQAAACTGGYFNHFLS